ncbi:hypothetical protein ADIAG_03187 [Paeniglutamicibacter gangotriensis Lz1y]|uniref:Uncharacterized protein n=1 Tax=Paeniglutamicibacter gangotriensis Lz1y TaxID=1276920 RepID=M7MM41_9MICC|nr:hypothetical protein ADIAG_03187 [Paeniglutamicibacter gangotriensis Lz1y]
MCQRFSACGGGTALDGSVHRASSRDDVQAAHRTTYLAIGRFAKFPKQLAPQAGKSLGSTFSVVTWHRHTPGAVRQQHQCEGMKR